MIITICHFGNTDRSVHITTVLNIYGLSKKASKIEIASIILPSDVFDMNAAMQLKIADFSKMPVLLNSKVEGLEKLCLDITGRTHNFFIGE